jgi:hypothetical protein
MDLLWDRDFCAAEGHCAAANPAPSQANVPIASRKRQRSHDLVPIRWESGGSAEGALTRFRLVDGHSDTMQDCRIRPKSAWGSSGRRFESCQPDNCDVSGHR